MRLFTSSALLVLLFFASAILAQSAYFRVSHGVESLAPISVYLNGTVVATDIPFGQTSTYFSTSPGPAVAHFFAANVSVVNVTVDLQAYSFYVLVATGAVNANETALLPKFTLLLENHAAPANPMTSSVTFFHGIADVPSVDVKINGQLSFSNVTYTEAVTITLPAGSTVVDITPHNNSLVVANITLSLQGGFVNTIFGVGLRSMSATLSPVENANYTYFNARVSHGVLGANPINVVLSNPADNSKQAVTAAPVSFGVFSAYSGPLPIYAGQIVMVTDSTNGQVLLSAPTAFMQNTLTTLAILSNGTSVEYVGLADSIAPAAQYTVSLRFINGIAGSGSVNVRIDGNLVFTDIPVLSGSNFEPVPSYRDGSLVEVLINGVVAFSTQTLLASGGVYTIAAYGKVGDAATKIFVNYDVEYDYVQVRFVNAVPNVPTMTVSTGSMDIAVDFGVTTTYSSYLITNSTTTFSWGANSIKVNPTWTKNTVYTVVLRGIDGDTTNPPTVQFFMDTVTAPQLSNTFSVRAIHLAPGVPAVTFNSNGVAVIPELSYGQSSAYQILPGNIQYTISVVTGANHSIVFNVENPVGGGVYTLLLVGGSTHNATFAIQLLAVGDAIYTYAMVRAVHASPDGGAVQVVLDDRQNEPLPPFAQISFKGITEYYAVPITGFNYTIEVQSGDNVLVSTVVSLMGSQSYTAAFVGFVEPKNISAPLQIVNFPDQIAAPTTSISSNIRIVHLAPGVPNVNVFLNSQLVNQWVDLAYTVASSYSSQMIVGDNNRFDVYNFGNSANILTIPEVSFSGGEVTSIFIFGGAALSAGLQNDKVFTYFNVRLSHAAPELPAVKAIINGNAQIISESASFNEITAWYQVVNAGTLNVAIVYASNGAAIVNKNIEFSADQDTTLILVGLNTTYPLDILAVANEPAIPSSNTVSKLRVGHLVPGAPNVNVRFLNYTGASFNNVTYLTVTDYMDFPQGLYTLQIFVVGSNNSFYHHPLNLTGGYSYTVFAEGLLSQVTYVTTVDFYPPNAFNLRVFHTSPNVGAVDALVDGSSYGFNGLSFGTDSMYRSLSEGTHHFVIQPANQINPTVLYVNQTLQLQAYNYYSVLLVGAHNGTNSSALTSITVLDDITLPVNAGDVRIRFIHASLDAPALTVRVSGEEQFSGVQYKSATNYTNMANNIYTFEVLMSSTQASVLSSTLDLRVKSTTGRAVYTIVAEGLVNPKEGEPGLKLFAFLDNGEGVPDQRSSSSVSSGLSGVAIGLIIAGVAVFVIVVAAGGFVFWKRRQQRAGYSPIDGHDH